MPGARGSRPRRRGQAAPAASVDDPLGQEGQEEDTGEGDSLTHALRVQLGMTFAALRRLPEAEAILLESVPQLPARSADTTRAVRFLVDFYEQWNRTQPDPARAARAADWRQHLTTPSTAAASHEQRHVARAQGVLEPTACPRALVFVQLRLNQRLCTYALDWICSISRFELSR